MYFEKLPENYQEAINRAVNEGIGHDNSDVALAFREWEAKALIECAISETDSPCESRDDEYGDDLCAFKGGWDAGRKQQPVML